MKLLIESLKNNRKCKIYLDMESTGNILFHLRDKKEHIPGYYLIGIDNDGMFLIRDVGETDSHNDNIESIDLNEHNNLKIIGVDLI